MTELSSMADEKIKPNPHYEPSKDHCAISVIKVPDEFENGNRPNAEARASYSTTLFHILAVSIGPAVFIIPSTFSMVGYVYAIVGIICISLFYVYNVRELLQSSDLLCSRLGRSGLSFAEVVKYAFEEGPFRLRPFARYTYTLMNILFIISWGGELAFNIVFLTENAKYLLDYNFGADIDIRWFVVSLLIPCILITSVRNAEVSILSVVATVVDILFLVIVMYIFNVNFNESRAPKIEAIRPLNNILQFLATIFFTLNFTGIAIPLRNKMEDSKKFDSRFGVLTVSVLIITMTNIVFGFMGYIRYGDDISNSVTLDLPLKNVLVQIVIVLYCIAIYFSYPSGYFVIFNIVWNEWVSKKLSKFPGNIVYECYIRICINVVLFSIILVLPKLSLFTDLGGLVCSMFDSIIIPSLLQILLSSNANGTTFTYVLVKNVVIIVFGVVLLFFGVFQCSSNILHG